MRLIRLTSQIISRKVSILSFDNSIVLDTEYIFGNGEYCKF